MKKRLDRGITLLIGSMLLLLFQPVNAYVTLIGNGTFPGTQNGTTFALAGNGILTAHVYFPNSEPYIGLNAGNGSYAISYGDLRTVTANPYLIPLALDPALNNQAITSLSAVQNSANVYSPTIVALVLGGTSLYAITKKNTTAVQSARFNDPAGNPTGGVVYSQCGYNVVPSAANVVIVPVKIAGTDAGTPFGTGAGGGNGTKTDGISAAYITQTSAGTPVWNYVGANGTANIATPFDLTTTGSYLISDGATPIANINHRCFHYDAIYQRFYVGISGTVAANGGGGVNGLYGIGIYPVTTSGQTVTVGAQLLPCGAATSTAGVVSPAGSIIGFSQAGAATGTFIGDIAVMHTSTGMGYLILSGNTIASGAGTTVVQTVYNQVYAVPLVNGNPANPATGCFANVHSGGRTLLAVAAGDLVTTASLAAVVGGGPLPITNSLLVGQPTPNAIQQISCDGDAVMISTGGSNPANGINESGYWKSQAVFNDLGQIDHWTDWQKIAPNNMGGQSANGVASDGSDPRVDLAHVDGYTGYVVTYNAFSLKANVSQWTKPTTSTPNSQPYLAAAVNNALNDQCYSVLDLNSSTTNWGSATSMRMTLFGGEGKVCFAITGSRSNPAGVTVIGTYTTINSSIADSFYDYTSTQTFYTSSLPTGAGAVVALGWSGWNPNTTTGSTTGFFFAGCAGTAGVAPGLYVYTPSGTLAGVGFNPVILGASAALGGTGAGAMVDLGLVTSAGVAGTGGWTRVNNVSGIPVKIESMGGGLHVLTRSATLDRIYSVSAQNTGLAINTSFVVTASSNTGSLASVQQIYDFVVSVSAASPAGPAATPAVGVEQLLMLTNGGIYTSSSTIGMQSYSGNLNQTAAGWELIDATSPIITRGYFADYLQVPSYNRLPQTFWFANYARSALSNTTEPGTTPTSVYNQNSEYQVSRQGFITAGATGVQFMTNSTTYGELPLPNFNGTTSPTATTAATCYQNFPVLARCFYNDGVRRYFIQKNPADDTAYQVVVLPYNLYDYSIGTSEKKPMQDVVVAQAKAFYWMSLIGDTGQLMMGTSNGVLSLQ